MIQPPMITTKPTVSRNLPTKRTHAAAQQQGGAFQLCPPAKSRYAWYDNVYA
jgi:hypothetical protein